MKQEKYTFGVKKAKISLQSPKTEFEAQHKYGRVIYPSIENFRWSKKKYTLRGQKGENKSLEPKIGTKDPKTSKSQKKCLISNETSYI
jgi:hypothetical protein